MPRRRSRKSQYVTKRSLPFQLMKYAETKQITQTLRNFLPILPGDTTQVFELTDILQGDETNERTGNEIQLRSFYARFWCNAVSSSGVFARFILYSPRLANSNTPPVVTGMGDRIDKDLYVVWLDKWISCSNQQGGGSGLVTMKKKWKPYMKVIYSGSTGTLVKKNGLYLQIITNVTLKCQVNGFASVFYKDI